MTALRAVCEGRIYLSSDLGKTAFPQSGPGRLSEREREVFLLLAKGATPKQVAVALDIGISTAYLHRSAVREKLGARNDLDLHRIALERGLV